MSRERPPARGPLPCRRRHFNEARLHEPGEAQATWRPPGASRHFNEARLHEPGEAPGRRAGDVPDLPHFNEARLHEPGEAMRSGAHVWRRPDFNEARLHEPGEAGGWPRSWPGPGSLQ